MDIICSGGIDIIKTILIFVSIIFCVIFTSCQDNAVYTDENVNNFNVTSVSESSTDTQTETKNQTKVNENQKTEIQNEYNISIDVIPDKKTVTGIQKVKIQNKTKTALNEIYFNTYLNAFNGTNNGPRPYFDNFKPKIYKYGDDYGYIKVLNAIVNNEDVNFEVDNTYICVKLDEPLEPNSIIDITFHFEAKIPKICHRTGSNDYAVWFGNFFPTVCVYDENGWNIDNYYPAGEPFYGEISNYNVTINVPNGYEVIGSGNSQVLKKEENITSYSFKSRMIREFAFAVSQYYKKNTRITDSGVEINFYHYTDIPNIEEFLDVAEKSLNYFSYYVGTYPYEVLNIAETELFLSGGMEYPEIIFIDSDYLKSEKSFKTLSHEVAHQWFYNIIGNNQSKEAWLDEGMSSFMQCLVYMSENELYNYMTDEYNDLNKNIENMKIKKINSSNSEYLSWNNYYNMQYLKPKLMIYSLKLKMGNDKFNQFLKEYYSRFSFKNVNKNDFIKTAEDIYGESLQDFFNQWLEGENLPSLQ